MPKATLSSLNPSDLVGALRSDFKLRSHVGVATVGTEEESAVYFTDERPAGLTSVDGVEVVVRNLQAEISTPLLDGRQARQFQITVFAASYTSADDLNRFVDVFTGYYGVSNVGITTLEDGDAYAAAINGADLGGVVAARQLVFTVPSKRYVGQQGDAVDAPKDGNQYVRQNGAWVIGSGGPAPDLTGYTTEQQLEARVARADGGYEFTGAFADRQSGQSGQNDFGTLVSYTSADAAVGRWRRFGFSAAANALNDNEYWGETDPNYDSAKGLFGGLHMPAGVTQLFDFSFDDTGSANSYSAEKPVVDSESETELRYSAANGSIDFGQCRVGDLALVRFDFNVKPQVANTTVEVAMIWATRNANDEITFTFPLTGEPIFYGTGTVGRTFLNRPLLTAYFASQEDVNARALLAIRADNPIQVAPLTTLVTLVR